MYISHVMARKKVSLKWAIKAFHSKEVIGDKHDAWNVKEDAILKMVRGGSSTHGKRMEYIDGTSKMHGGMENTVPRRESKDSSPYGKPFIAPSYTGQHVKSEGKDLIYSESYGDQHNNTNLRKVQEEEITKLKTYYNTAFPPPYVKSKDNKYGANLGSSHLGFDGNGVPKDPSMHIRANSGDRSEKNRLGSDHREREREVVGTTRVGSHDDKKDR